MCTHRVTPSSPASPSPSSQPRQSRRLVRRWRFARRRRGRLALGREQSLELRVRPLLRYRSATLTKLCSASFGTAGLAASPVGDNGPVFVAPSCCSAWTPYQVARTRTHPPSQSSKFLLHILHATSLHLRHDLLYARQTQSARAHRAHHARGAVRRRACTLGRHRRRGLPERSPRIAVRIFLQNIQLPGKEGLF